MQYFAHSSPDPSKPIPDGWQPPSEHLRGVAELARRMAAEMRLDASTVSNAAFAAGLLHEFGKYRNEFQDYLRDLSVPREKRYHKQAGAARAFDANHGPVAFAIAARPRPARSLHVPAPAV